MAEILPTLDSCPGERRAKPADNVRSGIRAARRAGSLSRYMVAPRCPS